MELEKLFRKANASMHAAKCEAWNVFKGCPLSSWWESKHVFNTSLTSGGLLIDFEKASTITNKFCFSPHKKAKDKLTASWCIEILAMMFDMSGNNGDFMRPGFEIEIDDERSIVVEFEFISLSGGKNPVGRIVGPFKTGETDEDEIACCGFEHRTFVGIKSMVATLKKIR